MHIVKINDIWHKFCRINYNYMRLSYNFKYCQGGLQMKRNDSKCISMALKNKIVLVIDDEDVVIELSEMMLQELGYGVVKAKNGSDGINLYKENQNQIALIISDMHMPEMDGQVVVNKLRKIDPAVKVILSSGGLSDRSEAEIVNMGFSGFLPKPYSISTLSKKLGQVLN